MEAQEPRHVTGPGGWRGTLHLDSPEPKRVEIILESGERAFVPRDALIPQDSRTFFLPLTLEQLRSSPGRQSVVVPVIEERLELEKRAHPTSRTIVQITPQERQQTVEMDLAYDDIEVERVQMGHVVEHPLPVRQEGDITIVPVYEEVLVVEKRLWLKEEIRIARHRRIHHERQDVVIRSEVARVHKLEPAPADPPDSAEFPQ